jgi:hypothetical protein
VLLVKSPTTIGANIAGRWVLIASTCMYAGKKTRKKERREEEMKDWMDESLFLQCQSSSSTNRLAIAFIESSASHPQVFLLGSVSTPAMRVEQFNPLVGVFQDG